jgi:hypothetical protein
MKTSLENSVKRLRHLQTEQDHSLAMPSGVRQLRKRRRTTRRVPGRSGRPPQRPKRTARQRSLGNSAFAEPDNAETSGTLRV